MGTQGAATNTEVRDLQPGVTYRLRVCAENEVGLGAWSPPAFFMQKPAVEKKALCSRGKKKTQQSYYNDFT
jgi:hypothetical protein